MDEEIGRGGGDGDDAAGGQGDGFEAGTRDLGGAGSGEEISEAVGRLSGAGEGRALAGSDNGDALNAEVLDIDESGAVRQGLRRDFAGAGLEFGGFEGFVDVEFAGAAVVEHAVGDVAVLLSFKDDGAGPDGVDGAGIDKDHVADVDREGIEALFEGSGGDFSLDLGKSDAGLEAEGDGGVRFGGKGVPALGFSAGLAVFIGHFVVGMDLDTEFLVGEDDFEEQRRPRCGGVGAEEGILLFGKEGGEGFAGLWACFNEAFVSGEPDFADQLSVGVTVVPGTEIGASPDHGAKPGGDAEGGQGCGGCIGVWHGIWSEAP